MSGPLESAMRWWKHNEPRSLHNKNAADKVQARPGEAEENRTIYRSCNGCGAEAAPESADAVIATPDSHAITAEPHEIPFSGNRGPLHPAAGSGDSAGAYGNTDQHGKSDAVPFTAHSVSSRPVIAHEVIESETGPSEEPRGIMPPSHGPGAYSPRKLIYPRTTLAPMFEQTADRFPDATFLIFNDHQYSYAEVLAQINRMAGGLSRLGVRRGDRILMTLPNCPEFVVSFFAILKLGATVINAGPLMGRDDLQTVMTMTSPRVVIGLDLQSPILGRLSEYSSVEHWVWVTLQFYQSVFKRIGYQFKLWHERDASVDSSRHVTFANLMANAPARPPSIGPEPHDVAVLQPTGGTTGGVRLVQLTHRNLICNAVQITASVGMIPGQERMVGCLPMFHVYGLSTCLLSTIYIAGSVVMTTRFEAERVVDLIRRYHPTIFPLAPAMCEPISDELEREQKQHRRAAPETLAGLRACVSGAAPLPAETATRFERMTGSQILEGYGLSEASPVTHVNLPGDIVRGSIGVPMADTLCRIVDVDDSTREMPVGEPGELLICGPQVMSGYFSNPAQTRRALQTDEQGKVWLHTGDVARMDEGGHYFIVDRMKDMIIRSGLKVYPAHVEKLLLTRADVADVAVIGRPDPIHTERVVAFVVLEQPVRTEQQPALAHDLQSFCRLHLAPYEVPQEIEFLPQLPRSPLGKLLKRELRKRAPQSSEAAGTEGLGESLRAAGGIDAGAAALGQIAGNPQMPDRINPPGAANGDYRSNPPTASNGNAHGDAPNRDGPHRMEHGTSPRDESPRHFPARSGYESGGPSQNGNGRHSAPPIDGKSSVSDPSKEVL